MDPGFVTQLASEASGIRYAWLLSMLTHYDWIQEAFWWHVRLAGQFLDRKKISIFWYRHNYATITKFNLQLCNSSYGFFSNKYNEMWKLLRRDSKLKSQKHFIGCVLPLKILVSPCDPTIFTAGGRERTHTSPTHGSISE